MSTEQPSVELTTRDVLQQVDRRLSLIEGDLRALGTKLDTKVDTRFYWTLGTILVSWMSTIVAVLFK